jgi:hypothetical protein
MNTSIPFSRAKVLPGPQPGGPKILPGRRSGSFDQAHSGRPNGAPLGTTTGLPSGSEKPLFTIQELVDHAGQLLPTKRVASCGKIFKQGYETTTLEYSHTANRARLTNLCPCGSPWDCPYCAKQRSEQDRRELSWACSDPNFKPLLITFTGSHHQGDDLAVWDTKFNKTCERVKGGRWWQATAAQFGIVHSVWGKEYTHGVNGWHPHRHMIMFCRPDVTTKEIKLMERGFRRQYMRITRQQGMKANWERGVVISDKEHDISEYIAKYGRLPVASGDWDIEHEIAKSVVKTGRKDGKTPFELLADSKSGDRRAGQLFVEYANHTNGKHPLHWSKGARKALLKGERPYVGPVALILDDWKPAVEITRSQFAALAKFRRIDELKQACVLYQGDPDRMWSWLAKTMHGLGVGPTINLSDFFEWKTSFHDPGNHDLSEYMAARF